jgi:toxin ParE1/3/4
LLCAYPQIGVQTDEPGIRRIVARPYPYLIFYEPTETTLIVHAIIHAARRPGKLFH